MRNNLTIKKVCGIRRTSWSLYLVMVGEAIVGQLEKWPNTQTEIHPWKAFKGTGFTREYIGAFYEPDGGKRAALKAILA